MDELSKYADAVMGDSSENSYFEVDAEIARGYQSSSPELRERQIGESVRRAFGRRPLRAVLPGA